MLKKHSELGTNEERTMCEVKAARRLNMAIMNLYGAPTKELDGKVLKTDRERDKYLNSVPTQHEKKIVSNFKHKLWEDWGFLVEEGDNRKK